MSQVVLVYHDPDIYVCDHFLTNKECSELCVLHTNRDAARSYVDSEHSDAITNNTRTSTFVELQDTHRLYPIVLKRALKLAGRLFSEHCCAKEAPQIIHYAPGQSFGIHHDAGTLHDNGSVHPVSGDMPGFRCVSVFVYLQAPAIGGRTCFPRCHNLRVRPVQGRAVIWRNNMKGENILDTRVCHCGEEVKRGIKVGMNVWLHAG